MPQTWIAIAITAACIVVAVTVVLLGFNASLPMLQHLLSPPFHHH